MRVAIYHNLPSGGAKRTLYEQVSRLAKKHPIDVYSLTCANHDFADIRPSVANHYLYPFEPSRLFGSPWGRLNQAVRLADLLRLRRLTSKIAQEIQGKDYDILFVTGCQFEKAPSILKQSIAIPKVYYCQEALRDLYEKMPSRPYDNRSKTRAALDRVDPLPSIYYNFLKQQDRRNLHSTNRVLVNSKFTRAEVQRIYQLAGHVSYHGVDTERFRPQQTSRSNYILSVGSLTPLKGFDFLITGVAQIPAMNRPPLVIASNFQNPPERSYLEQLAAKQNVKLHILGSVSDERLVQLYNEAQLTVYTPIREPFGLVPLESMACGTPVVGVREGGIPETVVHGETGLLVERDVASFAEAVKHFLDNPALAIEFGQRGREHVLQNWTWNQAAAIVEDHLRACLS